MLPAERRADLAAKADYFVAALTVRLEAAAFQSQNRYNRFL